MLRKTRLLFFTIGLSLYSISTLATETSSSLSYLKTSEHLKNSNSDCITSTSFLLAFNESHPLQSTIDKRGCCSHHSGVCGCADNGKQICCDGTLSPTCTC